MLVIATEIHCAHLKIPTGLTYVSLITVGCYRSGLLAIDIENRSSRYYIILVGVED